MNRSIFYESIEQQAKTENLVSDFTNSNGDNVIFYTIVEYYMYTYKITENNFILKRNVNFNRNIGFISNIIVLYKNKTIMNIIDQSDQNYGDYPWIFNFNDCMTNDDSISNKNIDYSLLHINMYDRYHNNIEINQELNDLLGFIPSCCTLYKKRKSHCYPRLVYIPNSSKNKLNLFTNALNTKNLLAIHEKDMKNNIIKHNINIYI